MFLLLALMCAVSFANPIAKAPNSVISENCELFTRSFFNVIREEPGNVFFSPISIQAALGMAYAGANGRTAEQLKTHGFLPEQRDASQFLGGALKGLNFQGNRNLTLKLANAMFYNQDFTVKNEYVAELSAGYNAMPLAVDFKNVTAAVEKLNEWTAKQTNDKIKKIVEPDEMDPSTMLALLNAIYFKGNWENPFDETYTKKMAFHTSSKDEKIVDFMHDESSSLKLKHDAALKAYIVELPYKEGVSMVIVLPDEMEGLKEIEPKLSNMSISQLLDGNSQKWGVPLKMPKFKIDKTINLIGPLVKMGLADIFDPIKADFSGISTIRTHISKAIQKSFIEVNEQGSEAAAVTLISVIPESSISYDQNLEITMDRPFIYYIYHKPSATILFFGRLSSP